MTREGKWGRLATRKRRLILFTIGRLCGSIRPGRRKCVGFVYAFGLARRERGGW